MHYKKYKKILSAQNGMNIYRGCTHGCIYCDSRSTCYQMQHDFEDIEIKTDAPLMLEQDLMSRRTKCMIGTGAMTDPYIQIEEVIQYTRQCLQVILKYGFGLAIQTKSDTILNDLDLLTAINNKTKCVVQMTLTTYDEDLCKIIEPNVSTTRARFEALKTLNEHGIPTIVWLSPLLPFINDTPENVTGLLQYCKEAKVKGILYFGAGLTLRQGNREYFYRALDENFPRLKQKYIDKFGYSYECKSENATVLDAMVEQFCRDESILFGPKACFEYLHRFETRQIEEQISFSSFFDQE